MCYDLRTEKFMFLTQEEVERRLNSKNNALKKLDRVDVRKPGVTDSPAKSFSGLTKEELDEIANGTKRILPFEKINFDQAVLIGAAQKTYGSEATAELFGVAPATVTRISNGRLNSNRIDENLLDAIASQQRTIRDISYTKLYQVFALLTTEKIKELGGKSAREIVSVAAKLGDIYRDATPQREETKSPNATFHIYQPGQKNVKEYKTVVVNSAIDVESSSRSQGYLDGSVDQSS